MIFRFLLVGCLVVGFSSCDSNRIYETNKDFDQAQWLLNDTTRFTFEVPDTTQAYNVLVNVRNTSEYETARLFMYYTLRDSAGQVLNAKQLELFLFDKKTGEPFGESGIGDIYAHQFTTEAAKHFPYRGAYSISLVHAMRTDTVAEILSVGARVEKVK